MTDTQQRAAAKAFANEDIEIPQFTDEIRNLLLEKAEK